MAPRTAALLAALALLAGALPHANGVRYTRCQLARQLFDKGFPKDQLPDWVCLVESESGRNTSAVGGPNKNGTYDYGLFQINGGLWCTLGQAGKGCNVKCEDLLTDDITASAECAHRIFKIQGFKAWHGWTKRCKGKALPDIESCFKDAKDE